jgi:hypothetical protein
MTRPTRPSKRDRSYYQEVDVSSSSEYLSSYGVADSKRERRFLRNVCIIAGSVLLATFLWFFFRTFFEERAVKQFISNLSSKNYKAAHAQFGCTDATPCRDYDFAKFMEDWGDKSAYADVSGVSITLAEPCGNTIWVTIKHPKLPELGLAVDPDTKVITYAPEARCPGVWRIRDFPGKLWSFIQRRT